MAPRVAGTPPVTASLLHEPDGRADTQSRRAPCREACERAIRYSHAENNPGAPQDSGLSLQGLGGAIWMKGFQSAIPKN